MGGVLRPGRSASPRSWGELRCPHTWGSFRLFRHFSASGVPRRLISPSGEARTDPGQRYWRRRIGPLQEKTLLTLQRLTRMWGCSQAAVFGCAERTPTSLSRGFGLRFRAASCSHNNLLGRSGSWLALRAGWSETAKAVFVSVQSVDRLNSPFPRTSKQTSN